MQRNHSKAMEKLSPESDPLLSRIMDSSTHKKLEVNYKSRKNTSNKGVLLI